MANNHDGPERLIQYRRCDSKARGRSSDVGVKQEGLQVNTL